MYIYIYISNLTLNKYKHNPKNGHEKKLLLTPT